MPPAESSIFASTAQVTATTGSPAASRSCRASRTASRTAAAYSGSHVVVRRTWSEIVIREHPARTRHRRARHAADPGTP